MLGPASPTYADFPGGTEAAAQSRPPTNTTCIQKSKQKKRNSPNSLFFFSLRSSLEHELCDPLQSYCLLFGDQRWEVGWRKNGRYPAHVLSTWPGSSDLAGHGSIPEENIKTLQDFPTVGSTWRLKDFSMWTGMENGKQGLRLIFIKIRMLSIFTEVKFYGCGGRNGMTKDPRTIGKCQGTQVTQGDYLYSTVFH